MATIRRAAPMVYAIIVVVMWMTVKGTAASVVSVVGAMLLGLMYVVIKPDPSERRGR